MLENTENFTIPERKFNAISTEMPADLETPVSAYLKVRKIGATFLLESAESVDRLGRYSFIGFASGHSLSADNEKVIYQNGDYSTTLTGDPLKAVKAVINSIKIVNDESVVGLLGAAVGYISYDYARYIENIPGKRT